MQATPAYELLANLRGIGPSAELEPADEERVSVLADVAACAGIRAAAVAMLLLLEVAQL